jgi:hypothetical protein
VAAVRIALLACVLALAAAGCGGDEGSPGGATPEPAREPATLLLDFTPNAVHARIY